MNTKVKVFIAFLAGIGVGGGVTYKLLKKYVDKIADEECESLRATFAHSVSLQNQRKAKEAEEAKKDEPEDDPIDYEASKKATIPPKEDLTSVYNRVRKDYTHVENGEATETTEEEYKESESSKHDHPYVISQDEFDNDKPNYDKLSFTYYDDDDTLADEHEEIVDDPDNLVGADALLSFGKESNDKDIVYARNDQLGIDFEISRVYGSYQEHVMGKTEPEDEE